MKIGNLHIRIHKIIDKDRTTLFHNHPFNYISIVLKNGYTEKYLDKGVEKTRSYRFLSVIKKNHSCYHRIDDIKGETITLFIAYGKYDWNAFNTLIKNENDGIFKRNINNKEIWCKKSNGIWFIGHHNKYNAKKETRHSIHQVNYENKNV